MTILANGLKSPVMKSFDRVANSDPELKEYWTKTKNHPNFYTHINHEGALTDESIKELLYLFKSIDKKEMNK